MGTGERPPVLLPRRFSPLSSILRPLSCGLGELAEARGSYGDTHGASKERSIPARVRAHAAKPIPSLSTAGMLYTRTGPPRLLMPIRRLELPNRALLLLPTLHADALSSRPKLANFSTLHDHPDARDCSPSAHSASTRYPLDAFRIVSCSSGLSRAGARFRRDCCGEPRR